MQCDSTLERQLSASILRITERSAFFATLSLFARFEASLQIPTAGTDGRTVFINPEFWGALTVPERDAVLLHEVLHAALSHVTRRAGRDPQTWNIAADLVVNGILTQEGYHLPAGHLRDEKLENLSAEQLYEVLLKPAQPPTAVPMKDLLDNKPGDASRPGPGTEKNAASPGEATPREGPLVTQDELEDHWRKALEQAQLAARALAAGKLPAGILREMPSVVGARLDWRSYLWRFLTRTPTDYADFDRRFVGRGIYLDALAGESVQVLVCVDTSGSVGGAEMAAFLAEVQEILRTYPHIRCDLYYADADLYGPYALTADAALPTPQGGGGTDFRPFFDRIATHPFLWGHTVAIYLTDGYGTFPEQPPRCPVLWAVTPGGLDLDRFPFGEAVRLLKSQPTPFIASR